MYTFSLNRDLHIFLTRMIINKALNVPIQCTLMHKIYQIKIKWKAEMVKGVYYKVMERKYSIRTSTTLPIRPDFN